MHSLAHLCLRPMTRDDYPRVRQLWEDHAANILTPDDSLHGIVAFLERNPELSLVAEDARRIVATALCGDDGRAGYIRHLVIDPAYQATELGGALISACIVKLKDLGIYECHLFTPESHRALSWHRMAGSKVTLDQDTAPPSNPRLAST